MLQAARNALRLPPPALWCGLGGLGVRDGGQNLRGCLNAAGDVDCVLSGEEEGEGIKNKELRIRN